MPRQRICFLTAEISPFAKTGGLGDVMGALDGTIVSTALPTIIADLDGTIFIVRDRTPAMIFDQGRVYYPDNGWG